MSRDCHAGLTNFRVSEVRQLKTSGSCGTRPKATEASPLGPDDDRMDRLRPTGTHGSVLDVGEPADVRSSADAGVCQAVVEAKLQIKPVNGLAF